MAYPSNFQWYIQVLLLILFVGLGAEYAKAQTYDLLIKGGHMIDPKNNINEPMDLAIKGDSIAEVAKNIPDSEAKKIIDAHGLYVVPGLINPYVHVYFGSDPNKGFDGGVGSVPPDAFSFRYGITTMVDGGDAGWRNFEDFKKRVVDQAKTRVLEWINIFGKGITNGNGTSSTDDISIKKTKAMIEKYPNIIVGVTVGHYNGKKWIPFKAAMRAAHSTGRPLFLEGDMPVLPLKGLLKRMKPGDIMTHTYAVWRGRTSIINKNKQLKLFVIEAQKKGILFDAASGRGSFTFGQAIPAVRQGFWPDTFGTGLHRYTMNSAVKSMLNAMSTFLNLGMDLEDIIEGATWTAAKAIHHKELGNLDEGSVADVALLKVIHGDFAFMDTAGKKIIGNEKLVAALTIRAGKVVWDRNGLTATSWWK